MANKQLVLIDAQYLSMAKTGIRTYIEQLISTSLRSDEYDFKVLHARDLSKLFALPGGKLLFHIYTFLWKQIWIPVIDLARKPYAIVFPDYHAPILRLRAKKLVVFHDAFFWESPEHYNRSWLSYYKWSILKGLSGSSHVIAVSDTSQSKLRSIIPESVPMTTVHQCFVEHGKGTSRLVDPFDLGGKPFILHVGVLEKRKNLQLLVRAFAQIQSSHPELQLIMAGQRGPRTDMDDYPVIKSIVEENGIRDRVHLPGHVTIEELDWLYSNALIYAFPSDNEGFGIPVLEAFWYELPILVSNQPALVEIGGDGVIVVPERSPEAWSKCLSELINSPDSQQLQISKGKLQLQKFSKNSFLMGIESTLT